MLKILEEFELPELFEEKNIQFILTSDSEMISDHSRMNHVEIKKIPLMPFDNFIERMKIEINNQKVDLIMISHVFFNSGMALEKINELFEDCIRKNCFLIVDCRLSAFLPLNFKAHYLLRETNPTHKISHEESIRRQTIFREQLSMLDHFFLCEKNILSVNYNYHGPFVTFALPSPSHALKLHKELKQHDVHCDVIDNRLRFSFLDYEYFDLSFLKIK